MYQHCGYECFLELDRTYKDVLPGKVTLRRVRQVSHEGKKKNLIARSEDWVTENVDMIYINMGVGQIYYKIQAVKFLIKLAAPLEMMRAVISQPGIAEEPIGILA